MEEEVEGWVEGDDKGCGDSPSNDDFGDSVIIGTIAAIVTTVLQTSSYLDVR